MQNNIFVLHANAFLEYIFDRPLCECSKRIFNDALLEKIDILLPSLVLDEITEVLCGNLNELYIVEQHLQCIEEPAKNNILTIVVPDTFVRMKATERARTGNKKVDSLS